MLGGELQIQHRYQRLAAGTEIGCVLDHVGAGIEEDLRVFAFGILGGLMEDVDLFLVWIWDRGIVVDWGRQGSGETCRPLTLRGFRPGIVGEQVEV